MWLVLSRLHGALHQLVYVSICVVNSFFDQSCSLPAVQISEAVESHILHLLLGEGASHEAIAGARERYRAGAGDTRVCPVVMSSGAPCAAEGGSTVTFLRHSGDVPCSDAFMPAGGDAVVGRCYDRFLASSHSCYKW